MIARGVLAAAALLALPATAQAQIAAPRLKTRTVTQLPRPLAAPYDARRDAGRDVDAAIARARKSGKPVLIDFGANWCADCRVLAAVLELPEMRGWIPAHFELVQVDIGQFDRNLDLPKRFGAPALEAVPALFILDPRTGKLRNKSETLALGDARIMQPQQMADWLARWAK
jgi:thiol-disulfide isomerase/thioredoxin